MLIALHAPPHRQFVLALKRAVCCSAADAPPLLAAASNLRRRRLLWQQDGLDVRQDAALRNRHARQQLVQLLVVPDRQLEVTRNDASLLVVAGRVAGQLEHLGRQVLHHGRQVDGRAGADPLGVVALAQQTVYASDGKLESRPARSRLRLSLNLASFASSRHVQLLMIEDNNTKTLKKRRFIYSRPKRQMHHVFDHAVRLHVSHHVVSLYRSDHVVSSSLARLYNPPSTGCRHFHSFHHATEAS